MNKNKKRLLSLSMATIIMTTALILFVPANVSACQVADPQGDQPDIEFNKLLENEDEITQMSATAGLIGDTYFAQTQGATHG